VATRNLGKVREIQAVLKDFGFATISLSDTAPILEPEETGATFAANALLKATYYHQATGLPALADDSGLMVDALGGAPGVLSARFAATDAARCARVLALMRDFPAPSERSARFVCAMCLYGPTGALEVEGCAAGLVATAPAGSNGFGYDPIFFYPPLARTFAQLDAAEKNRVSHRARALEALRERLARKHTTR
jgi:XTP/dITP diphosphohydrolase